MAILSKFLEDFSLASGIPLIGISRVAYTAAIAGYIYNVAIPEWKSRKAATNTGKNDEEEANVQTLVDQVSSKKEEVKPKSPAVNK